jgi:hypothetical protein
VEFRGRKDKVWSLAWAIVRGALLLLIVGVSTAYVALGASQPWDFETYYHAASAYNAGLNPYSVEALSRVAPATIELPFLYPPATLGLFLPWTALPLMTAATLWLACKAVILVFLAFLWRREFLNGVNVLALVAVTLFGFDLATLWDLRTGNVALIEALLLSLGLVAYSRARLAAAASLIGLASVFKLTPALLLSLLVLAPTSPRRRLGLILLGLAFPVAAMLVPPGLSSEWLAAISRSSAEIPPTRVNPSSFALAAALLRALELPSGVIPVITLCLYVLYCLAILLLSLGALFRTKSRLEQGLFVILLWLILSPRLVVYSYTLAVVPVLYVVDHRISNPWVRWAAVVIVITEGVIRLLPGQPPAWIAPVPLLVLWGAWLLWLRARPISAVHAGSARG